MSQTRRDFITSAAALAICAPHVARAQAEPEAVNLHLWNDVSRSVTDDDLAIQKGGIALAMRDPYIMDAILSQKDVLAYYGEFSQGGIIRVSPTRLDTESSIINFTDRILFTPREGGNMRTGTGISNALMYSLEYASRLNRSRGGAQNVIDISGDGLENASETWLQINQTAVIERGHQCNGIVLPDLSIGNEVPTMTPERYLWMVYEHYSRDVKTPDGFVEVVDSIEQYPMVFREKLRMELGLV